MIHRLSLLAAFSFLCVEGFSQNTHNTNNGVIINSTVIVTDPVYVPSAPTGSESNALDRRLQQMERKQQMEDIIRQNRIRAMSYEKSDFMLSPAERDDKRYKDRPTYVTTQVVNMRTESGTEYPIIRQLPKGTLVKVVEVDSFPYSDWWVVHVPGSEGTGCVYAKLLKPRL